MEKLHNTGFGDDYYPKASSTKEKQINLIFPKLKTFVYHQDIIKKVERPLTEWENIHT